MPTIYHWLMPISVDQARYDTLIGRAGYFATPTEKPRDDKPTPDANNVLNLGDYKLDTTGSADVTTTMQKAMNDAVARGSVLFVPPGTYSCKSLNVPKGLVMTSYSPSGYGFAVTKHATIALRAGTNDHLLKGAVGAAHVRITGIHFDGNKNNNTSGDIIHLDDAGVAEEAQWHIRDCFMDAAAGYGVYVGSGRRAVQLSDCTLNYSKLSGARINGSDAHVDRCIFGSNMEHGIGVGGTVCNVNDCDIYGNGTSGDTGTGDGITIFSTLTQVNIRGNRIDQNRRHGTLVSGSCESIVIDNNVYHGNSQHANGSYNGVHVLSTAGSITINANTFSVDGNVSNKSGYAVYLNTGCTARGHGNVMQSGAVVTGITNAPRRWAQTNSDRTCAWAPTNAIVANMNRADTVIGNVTGVLTSGRLFLAGGAVLPAGVPVTSITFLSGNAAIATPTNQWFCLVDQNLNVLAKTVDDTTGAWSTNAPKTLNLSSVYTPTVDTPVYLGIMIAATTVPDLRCANASNVPYQQAPIVCGGSTTGLTNPASLGATAGAITAANANPYAWVN